jgi:hypothetical protein
LSAGSGGIEISIRNLGNAPVTDAFWVDAYFNPTQIPSLNKEWETIAPAGAVWGVTGAGLSQLTPGGTLTLTSGDAFYSPADSSPLPFPAGAAVYALVDSVNYSTTYGNVLESNEDNNLFGPVVSTAAVGDAPAASAGTPSLEGLPQR